MTLFPPADGPAGLRAAAGRRLLPRAGRRARRPARRPAARGGRAGRDLGQHPPRRAGRWPPPSPTGRRGCCRASAWSPSSPTTRSAPLDLPAAGPGAAPQARARAAGRAALAAAEPRPRRRHRRLRPRRQPRRAARRDAGRGRRPRAPSPRVDAAEHAAHWQRSLRFLDAASPTTSPPPARPTGQGRMRAVAEALAAAWARGAAGASGDRRRLDRLARRDARLHGRGRAAAAGRAGAARASTPACRGGLGAARRRRRRRRRPSAARLPRGSPTRSASTPRAVPRLAPGARRPRPARNALVSLALRPAPVTDQWRTEGAALAGTPRRRPAPASTWVEAPDPRAEALAIALALREAAETGARAALVTPDRDARPPRHRRARPLGADPRRQRRPAAGADPARRAAAPARRAARRAR